MMFSKSYFSNRYFSVYFQVPRYSEPQGQLGDSPQAGGGGYAVWNRVEPDRGFRDLLQQDRDIINFVIGFTLTHL